METVPYTYDSLPTPRAHVGGLMLLLHGAVSVMRSSAWLHGLL